MLFINQKYFFSNCDKDDDQNRNGVDKNVALNSELNDPEQSSSTSSSAPSETQSSTIEMHSEETIETSDIQPSTSSKCHSPFDIGAEEEVGSPTSSAKRTKRSYRIRKSSSSSSDDDDGGGAADVNEKPVVDDVAGATAVAGNGDNEDNGDAASPSSPPSDNRSRRRGGAPVARIIYNLGTEGPTLQNFSHFLYEDPHIPTSLAGNLLELINTVPINEDPESASEGDNEEEESSESSSSVNSVHNSGGDSDASIEMKSYLVEEMHIREKEILDKIKPKYNWSAVPELHNREMGLTGKGRKCLTRPGGLGFQHRLYSSSHPVERLELMSKLERHTGCVNSLNFNRAGTLLASGSDDLAIIIWKWNSNKIVHQFMSGHRSNVFQTKFIEFGDRANDLNIVSSGRDGEVRHSVIKPSGGSSVSTILVKHSKAVHKIAISHNAPHEVLSAGEDGHIVRYDFRDNKIERLLTVKSRGRPLPLYSISINPLDQEFCVAGRDTYVRVYDRRNLKTSVKLLQPTHMTNVSITR